MISNPQVEALPTATATARQIGLGAVAVAEMRLVHDRPPSVAPSAALARAATPRIAHPGRELEARIYGRANFGARVRRTFYFHSGGWVVSTLKAHAKVGVPSHVSAASGTICRLRLFEAVPDGRPWRECGQRAPREALA